MDYRTTNVRTSDLESLVTEVLAWRHLASKGLLNSAHLGPQPAEDVDIIQVFFVQFLTHVGILFGKKAYREGGEGIR